MLTRLDTPHSTPSLPALVARHLSWTCAHLLPFSAKIVEQVRLWLARLDGHSSAPQRCLSSDGPTPQMYLSKKSSTKNVSVTKTHVLFGPVLKLWLSKRKETWATRVNEQPSHQVAKETTPKAADMSQKVLETWLRGQAESPSLFLIAFASKCEDDPSNDAINAANMR